MNGKRLSVIIPGYNNPDLWWQRCIDSVVVNLSIDDEIICIDDCSTLRPELLSEYSQKDPRIKVIFKTKHEGLSVARNEGMAVAQGEYITFIDSDDELMPETYKKAIDSLKESDSDVVVFGVRTIWVSERLYKDNVLQDLNIGEIGPVEIKKFFENSVLNYVWNKVYRRSFLKEKGLIFCADGEPCEDIIFVLNCIMAGARWSSISHIGIKYMRTHGTLLSRYKSSYVKGTNMATMIWRLYKTKTHNAISVLGELGEVSDRDLIFGEWDNVWSKGSPLSIKQRWNYAKKNRVALGRNPSILFIGKLIYTLLRKICYVGFVQRWHIKRVYPTVRGF